MVESTPLALRGGVLPVVGLTGGDSDASTAYAVHAAFEAHGGAPVLNRTGGVRIWVFEKTVDAVRAAFAARRLLKKTGTSGLRVALDLGRDDEEPGVPLAALLDEAGEHEVLVSRLAALVLFDVLPRSARLVERDGGRVFVLTEPAAHPVEARPPTQVA